jgi:hypothetical protein
MLGCCGLVTTLSMPVVPEPLSACTWLQVFDAPPEFFSQRQQSVPILSALVSVGRPLLLPTPLRHEPVLERYRLDVGKGTIEVRLCEVVASVRSSNQRMYSCAACIILLSSREL